MTRNLDIGPAAATPEHAEPTPEEGLRLLTVFQAIRGQAARTRIVHFAEAELQRETAAAHR